MLKDPAENFVEFVGQFCRLIEGHLDAVQKDMENTTSEVMGHVTKISTISQANKGQADAVLEETHVNPDESTKAMVDEIQGIVGDIFEQATQAKEAGEDLDALRDKLAHKNAETFEKGPTQLAQAFQEKMDKVGNLDGEIQEVLFEIMGSVSAHDKMAQCLSHVVIALHSLEVSLSYLLIDFEYRGSNPRIDIVKQDLKAHIYRDYTMEEEKEWFREVFPDFDVEELKAATKKKAS